MACSCEGVWKGAGGLAPVEYSAGMGSLFFSAAGCQKLLEWFTVRERECNRTYGPRRPRLWIRASWLEVVFSAPADWLVQTTLVFVRLRDWPWLCGASKSKAQDVDLLWRIPHLSETRVNMPLNPKYALSITSCSAGGTCTPVITVTTDESVTACLGRLWNTPSFRTSTSCVCRDGCLGFHLGVLAVGCKQTQMLFTDTAVLLTVMASHTICLCQHTHTHTKILVLLIHAWLDPVLHW